MKTDRGNHDESPNTARRCRPLLVLDEIEISYPEAWKISNAVRANPQPDLGVWPEHVYLPLNVWCSIVAWSWGVDVDAALDREKFDFAEDMLVLAALGPWRLTQGIYRFDPDVFDAVWNTPVEGDLPFDLLHRLPEWSLYVETPEIPWLGSVIHGFWANLSVWARQEDDAMDCSEAIHLVLDTEYGLFTKRVELGCPLALAIDRYADQIKNETRKGIQNTALSVEESQTISEALCALTAPMMSLLLYIVSEASETESDRRLPRTQKGGFVQAARPSIRNVGTRMGAELRKAWELERICGNPDKTRSGVRADKRPQRTGYWGRIDRGSEEEQKALIQWIPSVSVQEDGSKRLN